MEIPLLKRFRNLSGDRGWLLILVSLGWALTLGARIVYPTLLPYVRLEFEIGYTSVGLLVGVLWVTYGAMQFPGGIFADITTERAALAAGVVGTGVGIVAISSAAGLAVFVVGTVVLGIGTGLYGPSRITILSKAFPEKDSTAIGISQAAGNLGNALLPVIVGGASALVGWRIGFMALIPMLVIIAVGLWLMAPVENGTGRDLPLYDLLRRTPKAISRRSVYFGTGLLLCIMFVYQSLTGFLPTFLADVGAVSTTIAAILYGGFFASAIFIQILSGMLSDRYGPRMTVGVFAFLSLPGFGVLLFADGLVALALGVGSLSCLLGCFPPTHAYTVSAIPESVQGTGYGLLRTGYIGFGAAGPVVTGLVADRASFASAFLVLTVTIVLVILLALSLPALDDAR